jgi:hypothetical protein
MSEHSADWQAGWDARGREIDALIVAAFERHPSSSQKAWQEVLGQAAKREYQRGLKEARADD